MYVFFYENNSFIFFLRKKDVLKTLLTGGETIMKKYRVVFDILSKNMFFRELVPVHHPSIRHSSIKIFGVKNYEIPSLNWN